MRARRAYVVIQFGPLWPPLKSSLSLILRQWRAADGGETYLIARTPCRQRHSNAPLIVEKSSI